MQPDSAVLESIWNEYGERLRRFLRARVARPEDADDLAQEILIKVHKNLAQLKETDKLQSWLFQIARNALTDHYRKTGVNPAGASATQEELAFDGQEDGSIRAELTGCLEPFLKQLPDKYRDAVTAVDLQGQPQNRLAEQWGLSYSALKSRVQRGRALLRELFFQCCSYEIDARGRITGYQSKNGCC